MIKKTTRSILSLVMVTAITMSMASAANSATYPVDIADSAIVTERITIEEAIARGIDVDNIPQFETREEADMYLDMQKEILNSIEVQQINANHESVSATSAGVSVQAVDSYEAALLKITLYVSYTTSSSGASCTSHEAYTSAGGFSLGIGWDESECYSYKSGPDVVAFAAGDVTSSILFDGFIEIQRRPITLQGCVYFRH